jgi:hypothetical protein
LVTLDADAGLELRLEEIPRAIRGAGFQPGEMRLRARGQVERTGSAWRFCIAGWRRCFGIAGQPPPEGGASIEAVVDYSGAEPVLREVSSGAMSPGC